MHKQILHAEEKDINLYILYQIKPVSHTLKNVDFSKIHCEDHARVTQDEL